MKFTETKLKGAYIIESELLKDERGFFARSFCQKEFESYGLNPCIAQCNISYSSKRGTLRGMHLQITPHQEDKLVRCVRGAMYDVIIDLRPDSETYMKHFGIHLDANKQKMLYIPKGFAQGFLTLADHSEIFYQISEFYAPEYAIGYRWNDTAFGIEWPEEIKVISDRDNSYPDFQYA